MKSFLILITIMFLLSCNGGIRVIQPSGDEIVSIRNSNLSRMAVTDIENITPKAIPLRPGGPEPRSDIDKLGVPQQADLSIPPFDSAGKLVYKIGNLLKYCSFQLIGDGDVALTAAHCIYDNELSTPSWVDDMSFFEGYKQGIFETQHSWSCAAIYSGWQYEDFSRDYAFIKLPTSGDSMGISTTGVPSSVHAMGYPSNFNSGEILMKTLGGARPYGSGISMMASQFGKGSSGGAWFNNVNNAISVNSFKFTNDPNSMYGPVFDNKTMALYEFVKNDCAPLLPEKSLLNDMSLLSDSASISRSNDDSKIHKTLPDMITDSFYCDNELIISKTINKKIDENYLYEVKLQSITENGIKDFYAIIARTDEGYSCKTDSDSNVGITKIVDVSRIYEVNAFEEELITETISPAYCKRACEQAAGSASCMKAGVDADKVIRPLMKFIKEDLNNESTNNVIATKDDLIKTFGGVPDETNDPCNRSDFIEENGNIINSGYSCNLLSSGTEEALRLGLRLQEKVKGTPVSNSAASSFDTHAQRPTLEFTGDGSDIVNNLYGGKIKQVEKHNNIFIITTVNGCMFTEI